MPSARSFATLVATTLALATSGALAQPVVRSAHPRIFLVADGRRGISPATLVDRCTSATSPYARACRAAAPLPSTSGTSPIPNAEHPLVNLALRYILFRETATMDLVRQEASRTGPFSDAGDPVGQVASLARNARALALAFDWLYPYLTTSDRDTFITYLRAYGDFYVRAEPDDVFSAEAYVQASVAGLIGLALSGEAAAAMDAQRYLTYADTRWRTVLFPALAYTRDWWHEGAGSFFSVVARNALYYAAAFTTATDEDLFAWSRAHGDAFGAFGQYAAYVLRPDFRFANFGDSTDQQLNPARSLRPTLDMLAWGTGSPLAQGLAEETSRRVNIGQDYNGPEAWHQIFFYAPDRPQSPSRVDLPLAAHLSPTAEDVVVMRSSWTDEDATWVSLSCGDWFSTRQHIEAGSLQIFRRAPLVVSTGAYDGFETQHWLDWYAQRSVHASTLAVYRPDETFPNARGLPMVNDGGQRGMSYAGRGRRTLAEYRMNLTGGAQYETAGVTAFETSRFHDYAACDLTRAYNSDAVRTPGNTAKVREVSRQVVFLRPELVVVFDRVETTQPQYEKRFVLHGLNRPLLPAADAFTIPQTTGRLLGRTLLPRTTQRAVVAGFQVDGMTVTPLSTGNESLGARVEVTAPPNTARDYFLHVLDASLSSRDALPPSSLLEDGDRVGVRIGDPDGSRVYTLMFSRNGAVAGDLRVAAADGSLLYTGTLGAGGRFYAPVTDAGVPQVEADAGAAVDAGASPDAGPPDAPQPGCECSTPARSPRGGWGLAALALAAARRRRQSIGSPTKR